MFSIAMTEDIYNSLPVRQKDYIDLLGKIGRKKRDIDVI